MRKKVAANMALMDKSAKKRAKRRSYRWKSPSTRARSAKAGQKNLERFMQQTEQPPALDHAIDSFLRGMELPRDRQSCIRQADAIVAKISEKLAAATPCANASDYEATLVALRTGLCVLLLAERQLRKTGFDSRRGLPMRLLSLLSQHQGTVCRCMERLKEMSNPDHTRDDDADGVTAVRRRFGRLGIPLVTTAEAYVALIGKYDMDVLEEIESLMPERERKRILEVALGGDDEIVLSKSTTGIEPLEPGTEAPRWAPQPEAVEPAEFDADDA